MRRLRISAAIKELLKNLDDAQLDLGQAVYEEGLSGQDQSDLKKIVNTITELRDRLMKQKKGGRKMNRTGKLSHEDYEEIVKGMAEDFIKYFKMKTVDDLDDAWPNKWSDWAGTVDWLDELEIVEYLAPDWVFQEFMEDTKPEGMSEEEEEEWTERASEEEGDLIADYVWDQGGMGHGALINDVWREAEKMLGGKE